MDISCQHHSPAALPPAKKLCTHSVVGYVGPSACLNVSKKRYLTSAEIRTVDRPARSLFQYHWYVFDVV